MSGKRNVLKAELRIDHVIQRILALRNARDDVARAVPEFRLANNVRGAMDMDPIPEGTVLPWYEEKCDSQ